MIIVIIGIGSVTVHAFVMHSGGLSNLGPLG
jgi:hypothetical protein